MIESLKRALVRSKWVKDISKDHCKMQRLLLKKQIGQRVVEDAVNRVKGEDDKKKDGRVDRVVVKVKDI